MGAAGGMGALTLFGSACRPDIRLIARLCCHLACHAYQHRSTHGNSRCVYLTHACCSAQVLARVYMARSDVGYTVRTAAVHVWKTVVSNTPRTLGEILPALMEQVIDALASAGGRPGPNARHHVQNAGHLLRYCVRMAVRSPTPTPTLTTRALWFCVQNTALESAFISGQAEPNQK